MTTQRMFDPLYRPEGGKPRGFVCLVGERVMNNIRQARECGCVTSTQKGMLLHIFRVHHLRLQIELFPEMGGR